MKNLLKISAILVLLSLFFGCSSLDFEDLENPYSFEFRDNNNNSIVECSKVGTNLTVRCLVPVIRDSNLLSKYNSFDIKKQINERIEDGEVISKLVIEKMHTKEQKVIDLIKINSKIYTDKCDTCHYFEFHVQFDMPNDDVLIYMETQYKVSDGWFSSKWQKSLSNTIIFPICKPQNNCDGCKIAEFYTENNKIFKGQKVRLNWKTIGNCETFLRYNLNSTMEQVYGGTIMAEKGGRYDLILKCGDKVVDNKTIYLENPEELSRNQDGVHIFTLGEGESNLCDKKTSIKLYEVMIDTTHESIKVFSEYFSYGELLFKAARFNIPQLSMKTGAFYYKYKQICDVVYNVTQEANYALILVQGFADANVPADKLLRNFSQLDEIEKNIIKQQTLRYFNLSDNNLLTESKNVHTFNKNGVINKDLPNYRSIFLRNFLVNNSQFGANKKNFKLVPVGILEGKVKPGTPEDRTIRLIIITSDEEICLDNLKEYFE